MIEREGAGACWRFVGSPRGSLVDLVSWNAQGRFSVQHNL